MATIYRFIVEQKTSGASGRKGAKGDEPDKKTPSKKGKNISLLGGSKGGVEHNRKMRAINPLLNKMTGGWWEKGTRVGRAGMGIIKTGGTSAVGWAIIIAFVIQLLLKWQAREREKATKMNTQNYKALEMGVGSVRGEYEISQNIFTGRITYNQNK